MHTNNASKAGITYTIFERDPEFLYFNKTRDWGQGYCYNFEVPELIAVGMFLHWSSDYLFQLIPD